MYAHLDRAIQAVRKIGIPLTPAASPALPLLEQVAHYDATRVMTIAATLQQSSAFNEMVRTQLMGMDISTRYADIASAFDSVREDAQKMAQWMEDGRLDMGEKLQMNWMKLRRGSVPARFEDIKKTYLEVSRSAGDQIERERIILEAYQSFRLALKSAEVDAQTVLEAAQAKLNERRASLEAAQAALDELNNAGGAEQARRELARDEALRSLKDEDRAYQLVKDIADDLKTACNTAELVFARIQQTNDVKERLYQRAISFFSTNEVVFTGLSAAFTTSNGLGEATNTLEAMKDGMNKGLEALASTGGQQLEKGLRAGYGATLKPESVKALADAIVDFQSSSLELIASLRKESTEASREIESITDDAKRRFSDLLVKGV